MHIPLESRDETETTVPLPLEQFLLVGVPRSGGSLSALKNLLSQEPIQFADETLGPESGCSKSGLPRQ